MVCFCAGTKEATFPTLHGDFFTYTDRQAYYWSGYYSSRPWLKKLIYQLQSTHRAYMFAKVPAHPNYIIN